MKIELDRRIAGVLSLYPGQRFEDHRGTFEECWRDSEVGLGLTFKQENRVASKPGVFRGLHYDMRPTAGKLVWCESGAFLSFAFDTRKDSLSYLAVSSMALIPGEGYFWLPPGVAHGLLCLAEGACRYKLTEEYDPQYEAGVSYRELGAALPNMDLILSEKDSNAKTLLR